VGFSAHLSFSASSIFHFQNAAHDHKREIAERICLMQKNKHVREEKNEREFKLCLQSNDSKDIGTACMLCS
jgi:hypothetical protein